MSVTRDEIADLLTLVHAGSLLLAIAVLFSVYPVTFSSATKGPHWLLLESPLGAVASAGLAAVCWACFFWIGRSLRSKP